MKLEKFLNSFIYHYITFMSMCCGIGVRVCGSNAVVIIIADERLPKFLCAATNCASTHI